jgi:phosphatidate cytidylyltransferase
MLGTRALVAVILLPIIAVIIYLGGWWFAGFVLLILSLAYYEFNQLMGTADVRDILPWGVLFIAALVVDAQLPQVSLTGPAFTLFFIASLSWQLARADVAVPATNWCIGVAGAVYLGWLGHLFVSLRDLPSGALWFTLALVTTWITDSGAYFVGRSLGRHKMAPRLSPKKTWEGAVGGWVIGVLGGILLALVMKLEWQHGLAVGVLASTLAPFGDLSVSMFKRQVGAKDTGALLPGHGGMWDRLDSPLFVVPAVHLYVLWFVS